MSWGGLDPPPSSATALSLAGGEGEFDICFELGGRCRGVPAVQSQLAEPVQKVRHERGQPPTEWPRKNLQTEVVDST